MKPPRLPLKSAFRGVKLASRRLRIRRTSGVCRAQRSNFGEIDVIQAFETIKAKMTQLGRETRNGRRDIQKMVTEGVSRRLSGVSNDPSFGHLIMFGTGGVNAELMHDVAFRLNPLTELDIKELIGSIKMTNYLTATAACRPPINRRCRICGAPLRDGGR